MINFVVFVLVGLFASCLTAFMSMLLSSLFSVNNTFAGIIILSGIIVTCTCLILNKISDLTNIKK